MLIDSRSAILLAIDFQPRLLSVMSDADKTVATAERVLRFAARLNLPTLFTEQYREGLGETDASLSALCPAAPRIDKMTFSCYADPVVAKHLRPFSQVILMGVEAHICVLQTALDLIQTSTRTVYVIESAVTSRKPEEKALALQRMAAQGAHIVSFDMLAYECLRTANYPQFREISREFLR